MKVEEVNLKTKEAVDYLVQSLESGQGGFGELIGREGLAEAHLRVRSPFVFLPARAEPSLASRQTR